MRPNQSQLLFLSPLANDFAKRPVQCFQSTERPLGKGPVRDPRRIFENRPYFAYECFQRQIIEFNKVHISRFSSCRAEVRRRRITHHVSRSTPSPFPPANHTLSRSTQCVPPSYPRSYCCWCRASFARTPSPRALP